jgi:hypothetical protein
MWWSNTSYKRYPAVGGMYQATHSVWDDDDDYGYEATYKNCRWDYEERRYISMHDNKPLEVVEYDDEAELWQEDIEELAMEKFKVYMTYIDDESSLVECYTCASAYTINDDVWPTECPNCDACLHCGHYGGCTCWLGLDEFFHLAGFPLPHQTKHTTPKELTR